MLEISNESNNRPTIGLWQHGRHEGCMARWENRAILVGFQKGGNRGFAPTHIFLDIETPCRGFRASF